MAKRQLVSEMGVQEQSIWLGNHNFSEDARVRLVDLSRKMTDCPKCETPSKRHSVGYRYVNEVGLAEPVVLEIRASKHRCTSCKKIFSYPTGYISPPGSQYTNRVIRTAIDLHVEQDMTYREVCERMLEKYHVDIPLTTINEWVLAQRAEEGARVSKIEEEVRKRISEDKE